MDTHLNLNLIYEPEMESNKEDRPGSALKTVTPLLDGDVGHHEKCECGSQNKKTSGIITDNELELLVRERLELIKANNKLYQKMSKYRDKEKKLIYSYKRMHGHYNNLLNIRDKERSVFAKAIHDELGQMLAALQLNVSMIAMEYRDHEQLVARTVEMEEMLLISINSVQRITSELQPVMLDILGLADAMEWQAREFQRNTGIFCKTNIRTISKKMNSDVSSAMFQVFKEVLANLIHRPDITLVNLDLAERKFWLTMTVCYQGRTFAEKTDKDIQSFNFERLKERIEMLGGKLIFSESLKRGTLLFARLPFAEKESQHDHENTYSR